MYSQKLDREKDPKFKAFLEELRSLISILSTETNKNFYL